MRTSEISKDLIQIMNDNGFCNKAITEFSRFSEKLDRFIHSTYHTDQFDFDYGIKFLELNFDLPYPVEYRSLKFSLQRKLLYLMRMEEYQISGRFLEKYPKPAKNIPSTEEFLGLWREYERSLLMKDLAQATLRNYRRYILPFLIFLEKQGLKTIRDFNLQHLYNYANTLSHLNKQSFHDVLLHIRRFLHWLFICGYVNVDYYYLIDIPTCKEEKLKSIWKEEEIRLILNAIDRNTPQGKKDYAIFLLAAILGLRQGDIINLRFKNIDFKNKRIDLITQKNKKHLNEKLPDILLEALEDYIVHARPKRKDFDYIFLAHRAPYTPLVSASDSDRMARYLKKAGIEKGERSLGLHSFRHSLASLLVREKTSILTISEVLTHSSPETTDIYIKTDLKGLKECVLLVEPEELWG